MNQKYNTSMNSIKAKEGKKSKIKGHDMLKAHLQQQ